MAWLPDDVLNVHLYSEVHRERLSLAASMKDIDSAVGRLDNILMSLYVIVAALIMAVSLVCGEAFVL